MQSKIFLILSLAILSCGRSGNLSTLNESVTALESRIALVDSLVDSRNGYTFAHIGNNGFGECQLTFAISREGNNAIFAATATAHSNVGNPVLCVAPGTGQYSIDLADSTKTSISKMHYQNRGTTYEFTQQDGNLPHGAFHLDLEINGIYDVWQIVSMQGMMSSGNSDIGVNFTYDAQFDND